MPFQIRADVLAQLDPDERIKQLDALVQQARAADERSVAPIRDRVDAFERRYGMTSDELLARLADGTQKETAGIAEWLFLLDVLSG
jgi:hypothetical protein